MNAILEITDGTTTIDLLSTKSGFHLKDWIPALAGPKGTQVYQDSAFTDGKKKIFQVYDNIIDTFLLSVNNVTDDAIITDLQNLRRLLLGNDDYWQKDQPTTNVCYIRRRGSGETNISYAIIYEWSAPQDANPFMSPFFDRICRHSIEMFQIALGHSYWMAHPPGENQCVEVSALQGFTTNIQTSGILHAELVHIPHSIDTTYTYGRDATCDEEVFIANKHNKAQLTHIFYYSNAFSWYTNVLNSGVPYALFTALAAVGDDLYFIIDNRNTDSGVFCSLVFDLIPNGKLYIGTWQYYNGVAWVAIPYIKDNTQNFRNAGVRSVHWVQPANWHQCTIGHPTDRVEGYCVRWHITSAPGIALSATYQQNRDVYTIVTPFADIDSAQVTGDITALAKMYIRTATAYGAGGWYELLTGNDRWIVSLRSLSRGAGFSPYINFSQIQNPVGIVVDPNVGNHARWDGDNTTPTGWRITYAPVGVAWFADRIWIKFYPLYYEPNSVIHDYIGTYHAYIRCKQVGGYAGDIRVRLRIGSGMSTSATGTDIYTRDRGVENLEDWQVLDLGEVTLPTSSIMSNDMTPYQMCIAVQAYNTNTIPYILQIPQMYFYDLILMPVDEWIGDFGLNVNTEEDIADVLVHEDRLYIDSLYPKYNIRSYVDYLASDSNYYYLASLVSRSAKEFALLPNVDQRLWFFGLRSPTDLDKILPRVSQIFPCSTVRLYCNPRYLSMRGNR